MYNGDSFIQLHTSFRGIRVLDKALIPTNWEITTEIFPCGDTSETQANVAIAKVHYLFDYLLDGGMFVSAYNKWALKSLRNAQNPCVLMPNDPIDAKIAVVLQAKMNTLAGESLLFGCLDIQSDTAGGVSVSFIGDAEDHLPPMREWVGERAHFDQPWWFRDDGSTQDIVPRENDDLSKAPSFAYSLDFIHDSLQGRGQKAKVIRPSFRPRIIEGRKNENRQTDR